MWKIDEPSQLEFTLEILIFKVLFVVVFSFFGRSKNNIHKQHALEKIQNKQAKKL